MIPPRRFGSSWTVIACARRVPRACFRILVAFLLPTAFVVTLPAFAASIVGSRHDFGIPGASLACDFCHTPYHHTSSAGLIPLWTMASEARMFGIYGNPATTQTPLEPETLASRPGVSTRLCLSCHDGVNAGMVLYGPLGTRHHPSEPREQDLPEWPAYASCANCRPDLDRAARRPRVMGTSLIDDHPVSVRYPAMDSNPGFAAPPDTGGWGGASRGDVKLVGGIVECVSCHNVHDPAFRPFLRKSNAGSALCLTCHVR